MEDCTKVYKYYNTDVKIGMDNQDHFAPIGFTTGIQRWVAPSTGIYTYVNILLRSILLTCSDELFYMRYNTILYLILQFR